MSFVTTQPEALAAAAGSLQGIGSALSAQNAAAAAPTTGVVPAAADEVSALTAAQFAAHATIYQAVSAQAQAIHDQFVSVLGMSGASYSTAEITNTAATGR
jgi:PE family protein